MKMTALSLFSGAGGCSSGFYHTNKYQIIKAYDNNKSAITTYNANFGENIAEVIDLSSCSFSDLRIQNKMNPGDLDIIIGGPPCQGFSTAGTRIWDDPRNSLIRNYVEALREFQPKFFFMENVEGILTTANGDYIVEAIKHFTLLGYSVVLKKVYSQEYGIPQRRKRVIILGTRLPVLITFPEPKYPITGSIFRNSPITLRNAIEDLEDKIIPEIDQIPHIETGISLKRIENIKQGQSMKDLPEELQHESFKRRANRRVQDGTPSEKRGGAPSGIKRLVYDEPSLTITGASTREFIHPVKNRPLTIRECARIQTFDDSFLFYGKDSEKIQQIGNAIPPKLAEIFADHIHKIIQTGQHSSKKGLIDFSITKAEAMSPALQKTYHKLEKLLLQQNGDLFDENY